MRFEGGTWVIAHTQLAVVQDGKSLSLSVAGKIDENGQRFVLGSNARTGLDRRFLPSVRKVSPPAFGPPGPPPRRLSAWSDGQPSWPCVERSKWAGVWAVWGCQYWHDAHCSGSLSTASSVGSLTGRGLNVQSGHCEGWN